jgi:hypothetical protein
MRRRPKSPSSLLLIVASCTNDVSSSRGPADASVLDVAISLDAGGGPLEAGGAGGDAGENRADAGASGPDVSPTEMSIESIETSDGYTQIRQGSTHADDSGVDLVLTGSRLAAVTCVTVGEFAAFVRARPTVRSE